MWHDGEIAWSLSDAIPYIDEPLKSQFSQYVKTFIQENLLDPNKYQYRKVCLVYPERLVKDPCDENALHKVSWYLSNPNLTAERLYGLYRYAVATNDWALIANNWSFIKSLYQGFTNSWNQEAGFFIWEAWIAGNFSPHKQMAATLAIKEMALKANDSTMANAADTYLTRMQDRRVFWGKYVRSLYGSGILTKDDFPDPNDWGYDIKNLIPKEGYMDATNENRQPFLISASGTTLSGQYTGFREAVYPYYLISFSPIISEFAPILKNSLFDELDDYIKAVEMYNSWWYLGDYSHQPVIVGHEDDSMSPVLANDIFLSKAYVYNQTFQELAPFLPMSLENYGHKDMYRYQTLVALLKADGDGSNPDPTTAPVLKTGDANGDGKVDGIDYVIWLNNYGTSTTSGATKGDFNADGKVDGIDYAMWLNNYGS
jgi:hypothetical protein